MYEKSPLPDCRPKLTGKELHTNSQGAGIVIILCPPLQIKEDFYMKELTSYNRVAGYLNKMFDQLKRTFKTNDHNSIHSESLRTLFSAGGYLVIEEGCDA